MIKFIIGMYLISFIPEIMKAIKELDEPKAQEKTGRQNTPTKKPTPSATRKI